MTATRRGLEWQDDGLCAQVGADPFFLDPGGSAREAKATCARCPVLADCRTWALTTSYPVVTNGHVYETYVEGIWGGLTEHERSRIREATRTEEVAA